MREPSLDELVLLPEPLALDRHFDARNWRVVRWLLPLVVLLCIAGVAVAIETERPFVIALVVADLAATVAIFVFRKEEWLARTFRRILLAYLLFQFFLWIGMDVRFSTGDEYSSGFAAFLACFMIFLRLRISEALLLYGGLALSQLRVHLWRPSPEGWFSGPSEPDGMIILGVFLIVSLVWTRAQKQRFLLTYRKEVPRARERLRMREEIETARRIQLSMLPRHAPAVDWLELAAFSQPATEVGGDYYDWFVLSPSRVVLVIGDVAGHGVASGILLSGLRSCLYLLEEDLGDPVPVLQRLNPMVRRTGGRRMFVTLLAAVLDREAGTLAATSAGHLPLLRWDFRSGRCEEVGRGAPPLGTFPKTRFEEDVRPLAPGDLLVLSTDGVSETLDPHGREYGSGRLERIVAKGVEKGNPPREILDAVLADLADFRGRAEPEDDVTLVVVRVRGAGL
ncbi:MAG TPA: PP2C family protein-serine/threonine phosphatase [Thermoanaerobaculia bacterium]|nr:PP2C family protein-serine/threonine phosphatase [Thermoanaerobaculia bacterium]